MTAFSINSNDLVLPAKLFYMINTDRFLKIATCIFLCLLIFNQALAQKEIFIDLHYKEGNGALGDGIVPASDVEIEGYAHRLPKNENYRIKRIILNTAQNWQEQVLENKISRNEFLDHVSKYHVDTTNLYNGFLKPYLDLYFGKQDDSSYIFIPDLNHDRDFNNDTVIYYKKNSAAPIYIRLQFPVFDGTRLIDNTTCIQILPDDKNIDYGDSLKNSWQLMVGSYHHKYGSFQIEGKNYSINISNYSPSTIFTVRNTFLAIDTTAVEPLRKVDNANAFEYRIGDTIDISYSKFIFDDILKNGNIVKLNYLGRDTLGFGISKNYYVKELYGTGVNKQKITVDFKNSDKHFYIIDFFGSWCGPCIAALPRIREILSKHTQKLSVIGIANETDSTFKSLKNLILSKSINWPVIAETNILSQSIHNKLRVNDYPTYMLLDNRGKIIYRGIGKIGLEEIETSLQSF